jgi:sulfur-oxidizing protein SoxY
METDMAHKTDKTKARRRFIGHAAALAAAATLPRAHAAEGGLPTNTGHDDPSPQWDALRGKLYGTRRIVTGDASLVQLIIPLRAAYGASVPVKFVTRVPQSADRHLKQVRFVVDKNPSPVAATLALTPELGQADFETRLRVDEYSHVRAIGEMNDGSLHMASRYVKVSGGCSAPPNRDQMHLIGKTSFRIPEGLKRGEPTAADVTVIHPNDTGFELNNVTVMFIPPHFVRRVKVTYGEQLLFDADQDFSISENPTWRFRFVPRASGVLVAEVEDTKEQRFQARLDPATVA